MCPSFVTRTFGKVKNAKIPYRSMFLSTYEKLFGNVMALNRYLRIQYIAQENAKVTKSKVLDIGCFDGNMTKCVIGRENRVFGIDVKDYGIKKALPDVQFAVAKGEFLPFLDASFDFVFCSDVFEHVKAWENIVPEIYRVLRSGGTCLISTVDGYWESPVRLRSILLTYLSGGWKKALMGRFALSDEDLHKKFLGHIRYDITIERLVSMFQECEFMLLRKRTYCHSIGSFLMELFFSFNDKIRLVIFPLLKLFLPCDKWVRFGKAWQYYVVFKKGHE